MNTNKICFPKRLGIIIGIFSLIVFVVAFSWLLGAQKLSTNSRAGKACAEIKKSTNCSGRCQWTGSSCQPKNSNPQQTYNPSIINLGIGCSSEESAKNPNNLCPCDARHYGADRKGLDCNIDGQEPAYSFKCNSTVQGYEDYILNCCLMNYMRYKPTEPGVCFTKCTNETLGEEYNFVNSGSVYPGDREHYCVKTTDVNTGDRKLFKIKQ